MINRLLRLHSFCIIALLLLVFPVAPVAAQSTAFSYQGKLSDNGNPANGNYDFTFSLWDAASGGASVADIYLLLGVTVTNGSFTVALDFGAAAFPGANRYLEIAVRPANTGSYTTLTPRQQILSTPYAIRSAGATAADGLSVACVNCITSSQIQSVNGSAVTGAIPVASIPAGSDNYIQNGTAQQPTSNFNLSGTGTANILNAATQYNLNGLRAFTVNGAYNNGVEIFTASNTFTGEGAGLNTTPDPSSTGSNGKFNSFYGAGAGQANTTGNSNAIFGSRAGFANTTGFSNAFFGALAGRANISGSGNAFFGVGAGLSNTTGGSNAFFGLSAGNANTTGNLNAFFGAFAGQANTTADSNAFFGALAGQANTSGSGNAFFGSHTGNANTTGTFNAFFGSRAGNANTTGELNTFFGFQSGYGNITGSGSAFFGLSAGFSNTTGVNNTMIGIAADVGAGNLTNATAIGARAVVTQSNSLALGAINGVNGCVPVNNCDSVNVGIGTTAPTERLHVVGNGLITGNLTVNGTLNLPSFAGQFIQNSATQQANSNLNISGNGIVGGSLSVGNAGTSARLYLNRASPIGSNSADINFFSAGSPDFALGTSLGSAAPSDFSIYNYGTGSNALMIRKASGNVGIGTTVPNAKLQVVGGNNTGVFGSSTDFTGVLGESINGDGVRGDSTTAVGVLGVSTDYAGVYGTSTNGYGVYGSSPNYAGYFQGNVYVTGIVIENSDERLKQNITTLDYGLSEVLRLRPVTWRWKAQPERGPHLGLVAQEVEPVLPELVLTAKDDEQTKGLNYVGLVPVLVNAIQEQQQQLDQQRERISLQQAEIETLQHELRQAKQQKELIQQQQQEMTAIRQLLCASYPEATFCIAKSVK